MAKEEIYILDSNFDTFAVVDTFESFIWTDRYYEAGEFEIVTVANKYYLDIFRQDYYVYFARSEHLMIIEQIEIDSDAEDGNKLKVKGRSLEALLDRRVIWGWKTLNTDVQNGIKTLINENVISPSNNKRKFPNFVFKDTTDAHILETRMDTQYFGENLYDSIVDICKTLNLGFKVTVNAEKKLEFELYYSTFHNCDQDENPYVIFSVDYDNLINSNYVSSTVNYKTVALVGGEGEGSEKKYTSYELSTSGTGYQRREMYTNQSGVTSDLGEEELDSADYDQLLKSKGAKELAENIITEEFEGETMDTTFVYGVDYKLGDVVTLRNEYGKSSISRVIEYTFSKNATEDKAYPTFATVPDNIEMVYRNFDPTKKYSAGDRVEYDDMIYEALTDIEPGPFDESQWKEVKDSKPREIVELLWRHPGVVSPSYDVNVQKVLLDHPFMEYDFVLIVSNKHYADPVSRANLQVRWNVEDGGGDWCCLIPSSWLKMFNDSDWGINGNNSSLEVEPNVDQGTYADVDLLSVAERTDDIIHFGNNYRLEIYGVCLDKLRSGGFPPRLIYGDGWTLNAYSGAGGFTLNESINHFDYIYFMTTIDSLDYANLNPRSSVANIQYRIFPVYFLNEMITKNREIISGGGTASNTWCLRLPDGANDIYISSDVRFDKDTSHGYAWTGTFAAYGGKATRITKLFGSLDRFDNKTDIELESPFTNYDLLIFITTSGSTGNNHRFFSSSVVSCKELEYLWRCHQSGEGLVALSGFYVQWTYFDYYQAFKVVSNIKFEYVEANYGYREGGDFTVAEVYGVKF